MHSIDPTTPAYFSISQGLYADTVFWASREEYVLAGQPVHVKDVVLNVPCTHMLHTALFCPVYLLLHAHDTAEIDPSGDELSSK